MKKRFCFFEQIEVQKLTKTATRIAGESQVTVRIGSGGSFLVLFAFSNGKMNDDNGNDDESKGKNTLTSSTAEIASKNRQKVCK